MPDFIVTVLAQRNEKGKSKWYGKAFLRNFGDEKKAEEWGDKHRLIRYPPEQWADHMTVVVSKEEAILNARKADAGEMGAFSPLEAALPHIPMAAAKTDSGPSPIDNNQQPTLQLKASDNGLNETVKQQIDNLLREWLKTPIALQFVNGHAAISTCKDMLRTLFMKDVQMQERCQQICSSKIDIENFARQTLDAFYEGRAQAQS